MIAAVALSVGVVLGLSVTSAAAETPLAVLLLPLRPLGTVTVKQASGVRFTLKSAIDDGVVLTEDSAPGATPASDPDGPRYARVLPESKDDKRQAEDCELDIACLRSIASLRGADIIVAGELAPAADGLRLKLVAVGGDSAPDVERRVPLTLRGNPEDDAADVDRALRVLIQPDALRGSLYVEGEPGGRVFLDGVEIGVLPLKQQKNGVPEGSHEVIVKVGEREMYRRSVAVVHRETTLVRAQLLDAARIAADPSVPTDAGPPVAGIALTSVGAALLVGGAVCGTLSLFAAWEAEARAKEQQLLFPRDAGLLWRGQVLAWSANALYVVGAAGVAGGVALLVLPPSEGPSEPSANSANSAASRIGGTP